MDDFLKAAYQDPWPAILGGLAVASIVYWFAVYVRALVKSVRLRERALTSSPIQTWTYLHDVGDTVKGLDAVLDSVHTRLDVLATSAGDFVGHFPTALQRCIVRVATVGEDRVKVRFILADPADAQLCNRMADLTQTDRSTLVAALNATIKTLSEFKVKFPKVIDWRLFRGDALGYSMWIADDGAGCRANLRTYFYSSRGPVFRGHESGFVQRCKDEFEARWEGLK